jgi:hypothetical protein
MLLQPNHLLAFSLDISGDPICVASGGSLAFRTRMFFTFDAWHLLVSATSLNIFESRFEFSCSQQAYTPVEVN